MKTLNYALQNRKSRNSGFSLVELILVLFVMGALILLIAPRFMASSEATRVNTEAENIASLAGVVKTMFGNIGTYSHLKGEETHHIITESSSFPSSLRVPNTPGSIRNQWSSNGTEIMAYQHDQNGFFVIRTREVPKDSCISLVMSTFSNYAVVSKGGTLQSRIKDPSEAYSACNNEKNEIDFIFR